ncbi:MAG: hypothetical protein AB7K35_06055 [Pseudorhodoplanes sp.]
MRASERIGRILATLPRRRRFARAQSGEVETGSLQIARQTKKLDPDPIQADRIGVWGAAGGAETVSLRPVHLSRGHPT